MSNNTIDLTQRPPRSARSRLGGYALLPRMLDKGRATLAGKNGEYHYNCPLDQHFVNFVGIDADALKEQLATGAGDGEILKWIEANATHRRSPWEIAQWTAWRDTATPGDVETREFFNNYHKTCGSEREDIVTWPDLLDLDDYVTFGGKA
jgi:hypothetical protein